MTLAPKVVKIDAAVADGSLPKEHRDALVVACADPAFDLDAVIDRIKEVAALAASKAVSADLAEAMTAKILAKVITVEAVDPVTLLSSMMEKKELLRHQPWRARLDKFERQWAAIDSEDAEAHKSLFENASRNGTMSPYSMLVLSYLLYGTEGDRHRLAGSLLRDPEHALESHNWRVAHQLGSAFLDVHGMKLETLEFPLFPQEKQFSAINDRVLQECGIVVGGAPGDLHLQPNRPGRKKRCSAFRNGASVTAAVAGEPWLQVQFEADGTGWVDGASINEVFHAERERVDELAKELANIRRDLAKQAATAAATATTQAQAAGAGKKSDKPAPTLEESMAQLLKRLATLQKRLERDERYETLKKKIQSDLRRRSGRGTKAGANDEDEWEGSQVF